MKQSVTRPGNNSPISPTPIYPTHKSTVPKKHELDNRSRQLDPENDAFWRSRGLPRPELKTKTR